MLTQMQWFLLAMFVSGVIGFVRGWERSVITSTIVVLATWFLLLAGDIWFAHVLTDWQALGSMPSTQVIHAVSAPVYGAVFVMAHFIGSAWGSLPKTGIQRWAGIVPGAINGVALLAYLNHWAAPALFAGTFTNYFPLLFGIGIILNLFFLFMTAKSAKSK